MPTYEYQCQKCGAEFTREQNVREPADPRCVKCGDEHSAQRMISNTSFVLKGGGWYKDGY